MKNLCLKYILMLPTLAALLTLGAAAGHAQALSIGVMPDSGVLVSGPRVHSSQNLEKSLVDITAVDPQTLQERDSKVVVGRTQRNGQGIIIDGSGIIVTNKHIIENAEHIYVKLAGGRTFEAKVIRNGSTDFTFIKIDAPVALRAISLGDSSRIEIGNAVVAFANANLNAQRERNGRISQLFREVASNKVEILEVNIPLRPGDSGGPILSQEGALLGLIMASQKSDKNKSYAIASNAIQKEFFNYKNSILN